MSDASVPVATLGADQQTAILNGEVAKYASKGWTVSSVQGSQAVLQRKKRIGVFWNVLLSFVTAGLWLIVVAVKLANRKIESKIITVDAYGRVRVR